MVVFVCLESSLPSRGAAISVAAGKVFFERILYMGWEGVINYYILHLINLMFIAFALL